MDAMSQGVCAAKGGEVLEPGTWGSKTPPTGSGVDA